VDDVDGAAGFLRENGFNQGKRGHVVVLPKIGKFENEIERVYLDCVANGGRSILDAIAIDLMYGDQLTTRANFIIQDVKKVQEELKISEHEPAYKRSN